MKKFFFFLLASFLYAPVALAQPPSPDLSGFSFGLVDRLRGASVPQIIGGIIRFATGLVGVYFLVLFIWGGILIMTAGGSSEKVKAGRHRLINASIGICIVAVSYMVVNFVIAALSAVTA